MSRGGRRSSSSLPRDAPKDDNEAGELGVAGELDGDGDSDESPEVKQGVEGSSEGEADMDRDDDEDEVALRREVLLYGWKELGWVESGLRECRMSRLRLRSTTLLLRYRVGSHVHCSPILTLLVADSESAHRDSDAAEEEEEPGDSIEGSVLLE